MTSLWRDLRLAARGLGKARAFAATVILTLAVGIGLNTAIFTVVDCVLLRPLDYRDANRIVAIQTHFIEQGRSSPRVGGGDYNDLRREVHGLESVAWYNNFAGDGLLVRGSSLYEPVAIVAPSFADVLGVQPVAGRLFDPSEARGTDALVSAPFARAHWGSVGAALGASITYTGSVYTVVGVLPEGFGFPGKTEVWFERDAEIHEARSNYSDHAVARRRAGVSEAQLDAELRTWSARMERSVAEDHDKSWEAVSLQEQLVGPVRPTLRLLLGGSGLLLLVVCANLAHLQLVRATRGVRALTIRTALGAGRWALLRGALLETVLLASAGGVGAVLVAQPALELLKRMAPQDLPRLADVRLNGEVFGYSVLVSLLVMVAATLVPVWRSWHLDPASALRSDAGRGTEGRGAMRLRQGLLVAEIALTLTLSIAAVLLGQQLAAEDRQQLGFEPAPLVVLDTHAVISTPAPEEAKDDSPAEKARVDAGWKAIGAANLRRAEAAVETVRGMPGVVDAEAIDRAPMSVGGVDVSYAVRGRQVFAPGAMNLPDAEVRVVTPGFFPALGVPLLRGRGLLGTDRVETQRVAVVNEALVRQSFQGEDPVGRQIVCGFDTEGSAPDTTWLIVGVVADLRGETPGVAPRPTFYVPLEQHAEVAADVQVVARVHGEPRSMAEQMARLLTAAHPDEAVKATTMREAIQLTERPERFRSALFLSFALVSIVLAAVGTWGVTAYTVEQRKREFAVRMALGADRGRVLGMVLGGVSRMAAVGVGLGVVLSMAAARGMASVLGAMGGGAGGWSDELGYGLAGAGVFALVLVAALGPARRASATEPMDALRAE